MSSVSPYDVVLARLAARGRFGMRLGLSRTRALLRALGNPQLGLRGVLIGGTNGKGSTQALVASVLREAGVRVGQTPKPHLVSYRERIQVGGEPISEEDFCALLDEVLRVDEKLTERHGPSTEFEVLTSAAFLHFARSGVEVGVIEVGIGGRLDATNVWQGGVTAVTNVELDHMDVLGPTVRAIAREKAMIIKRGDHAAVTGATGIGLNVLRQRARRVGVSLHEAEPWQTVSVGRNGTELRQASNGDVQRVALSGAHQAANVAVAHGIVTALDEAGIARSGGDAWQRGIANARWPGRMELIGARGTPDVLLDGAHNPHGVAALAASLRELLPQLSGGAPTVLMAVMANHWQQHMLDPLLDVLPTATVFATSVPGAPSSMPPARLAAEWGPGARAIADPETALDAALTNARRLGGPLIVCGSLYLVGKARSVIVGAGPAA